MVYEKTAKFGQHENKRYHSITTSMLKSQTLCILVQWRFICVDYGDHGDYESLDVYRPGLVYENGGQGNH